APVSWSFATASAPTVTATSPSDGTGYVQRTSAVTATFSRAMDPATLTSSTFTLIASDGTSVPATVSYDAGSQTATLQPSQQLAGSAVYTARLDSAVAVPAGNGLAAPVAWSFS